MRWRTANRRRKLVNILAALNPCIRLVCRTPKSQKTDPFGFFEPFSPADMGPIIRSIMKGPRKPVEPFVWNHKNDAIPRPGHLSEVSFIPVIPSFAALELDDVSRAEAIEYMRRITSRISRQILSCVVIAPELPAEIHGEEEGAVCGRAGCVGVLVMKSPFTDQGCSCFRSAPCGYCMSQVPTCPECLWSGEPPE